MAPPSAVTAVGVFLASADPPRLLAFYRALGVPLGDEGYGTIGGATPAEGSIFSIMPASMPLPEAPAESISEEPYGRRRITLNLRVDDIDAVVQGLRARGTEVAGPKDYGYGIFAWTHDPDGNVIELWEPGAAPPS